MLAYLYDLQSPRRSSYTALLCTSPAPSPPYFIFPLPLPALLNRLINENETNFICLLQSILTNYLKTTISSNIHVSRVMRWWRRRRRMVLPVTSLTRLLPRRALLPHTAANSFITTSESSWVYLGYHWLHHIIQSYVQPGSNRLFSICGMAGHVRYLASEGTSGARPQMHLRFSQPKDFFHGVSQKNIRNFILTS